MLKPFALPALALAFLANGAPLAIAQPSAVHKTTLQTQDFPPPRDDTVTVQTVVDKGG